MYEIPGPDEIRKFMFDNNLTGADIAALAGVKSRTARSWVAPPGSKSAREVPWAAWMMILLLTGKTTKKDIFKMVDNWKRETKGRGIFERDPRGRPVKDEK